MSTTADDSAPAPLPPGALVLVTLSLALAVFMNVLDVSIANVSIPTIAGNLGVSTSNGTWVITSFAVANAIAVPVSGWLAKRVGEVKLFVWCTVLFTLFSFLCGISGSFVMLLVMRAAQGVVAGPMIPLSQSLLLANDPRMDPKKDPRAEPPLETYANPLMMKKALVHLFDSRKAPKALQMGARQAGT